MKKKDILYITAIALLLINSVFTEITLDKTVHLVLAISKNTDMSDKIQFSNDSSICAKLQEIKELEGTSPVKIKKFGK